MTTRSTPPLSLIFDIPANPSISNNMRLRKQSSDEMRRRSLINVLTFSGITCIFGGSADPSVKVAVVAAAAEEAPVSADQQRLDLVDRYLQAISEAGGGGADAVGSGCFFDGWDTFCQDSPSFVSAMGANCPIHHRFDCTLLQVIGYTEQEVYDVISNCPCACKVPCGQWTFTPSAAPSSSPSSTPSASPSASPTSRPSDAPSTLPTSSPSSSPSATPSAAPTASPSSAPSSGPTISMAPSASPSASPTAAPSISLSPTYPLQQKIFGLGKQEGKGNSSTSMIGGILAAFAGVFGVVAMAYCAKREGFNKDWGEPVNSSGSKELTLTTEEYKSDTFSKDKKTGSNDPHVEPKSLDAKKTGSDDVERGNAASGKSPSPMVVQLNSNSRESAGSLPRSHHVKEDTECTLATEEYISRMFKKAKNIRKAKKAGSTDLERGNVGSTCSEECIAAQLHSNSQEIDWSLPQPLYVPMMSEDRIEIIEVEVPAMENASALSTCSDYIEVVRESSAESDPTMTAGSTIGRYTLRPTEESSDSDQLSLSLFAQTSSMSSSSGSSGLNIDLDNFSC